jgi:hypothetical protein
MSLDRCIAGPGVSLVGGGARPFPDGFAARMRRTACVAAPHATHMRFAPVK